MIATVAEAAAATGEEAWRRAAVDAGAFLLARLRRDDGRWQRSWHADAGARHLAFAADHAALVDAFTRLAECTGESRWIDEARGAADALLDLFWDGDRGGLFTTGYDAEQLVARQKDLIDNATPAANGQAAFALLRLSALTGDARYEEHALAILRLLGRPAAQHPTAFPHLLGALDLALGGTTEVAVVGERPDLVRAVQQRYLPGAVLAWGERYDSPLWEGRSDGRAYVCRNFACREPVTTVEALAAQLAA